MAEIITDCIKSDVNDIEDLIVDVGSNKARISKSIIVRSRNRNKENVENFISSDSGQIPGTQKIYIKTWGCAHNNSDSEYMAGLLSSYGYNIIQDKLEAHLWLLNSCTVKNPAEDHFKNEIKAAQNLGKYVVVAGCVSQGAPNATFIKNLSIIGVQQIDRVIEVVEETLKGNSVKLLKSKKYHGKKIGGASLLLPKIRRNPLIEIIAISTGCLNQCTYCKTKHARGELGSYPISEIIERAKQAFSEGVVEIWLTSEDTGAYGRDIGTTLPELLWKLIKVIPKGCRLRLGMTNPPYILEHLDQMALILAHPRVYSFLHVPVQSGSDSILSDMKREYCIDDFKYLVDFLTSRIPGMTIATDVICGFPTETDEDFNETIKLCEKYKFNSLFINQFFPRPGTPAALMNRIPSQIVKKRTKQLTNLFHLYEPYRKKIGEIYEILITEISSDKKHFVGHNKYYEQVLIPMNNELMGKLIKVKIIDATKFSMIGQPLLGNIVDFSNNYTISTTKIIKQLIPNMTIYLIFFIIFFIFMSRIIWMIWSM